MKRTWLAAAAAAVVIVSGAAVRSNAGTAVFADVTPEELNSNTALIGDVDKDGQINSKDALTILRTSVGFEHLMGISQLLADVDKDGSITSSDALDVLRYSVGTSVKSKVGQPIISSEDKDPDSNNDDTDSAENSDAHIDTDSAEHSDAYTDTDIEHTDAELEYVVIPPDTEPKGFIGHTITFETSGGTNLAREFVWEDSATYPPVEPDKEGYIFDGWYENESDSHPFPFGGKLEEDVTLYARWTDKNFMLSASEKDVMIPASGEGKRIRLTLVSTSQAPEGITVTYGRENEMTNTVVLFDNALPENGDDIMGDSVYSAYVTLFDADTTVYFEAEYNSTKSNVVRVKTYAELKEGEVSLSETVIDSIKELKESEGFWDLNIEERKAKVLRLIDDYVEQGVIIQVLVSENEPCITFVTSDGVTGGTYYDKQIYGTTSRENYSINDIKHFSGSGEVDAFNMCVLNSFPYFYNSVDEQISSEEFIQLTKLWTNQLDYEDNPTIEMYRNLDKYDKICIFSHGNLREFWDKDLSSFVCYPCIALPVEALRSESHKTINFLKDTNQIEIFDNIIFITPLFFLNNYDKYDFNNVDIVSTCCYLLGGNAWGDPTQYNYYLANAFMSRSAKIFLGMHHEVFTVYSSNFVSSFIINLENGMDYRGAFCAALDEVGRTDEEYINNNNIVGKKKNPGSAYPVLVQKDTVIAEWVDKDDIIAEMPNNKDWIEKEGTPQSDEIENPSFEDSLPNSDSIFGFKTSGDVRTVPGLGSNYAADGKWCVCVGTGISSEDNAIKHDAMFSWISQKVSVPKNAKQLAFRYVFISEEPTEWVGKRFGPITYDDGFKITINKSKYGHIMTGEQVIESRGYTYPSGVQYSGEVLSEITLVTAYSYNSSSWSQCFDVNFEGGDDTVYQTGWRSAVIDVSEWQGSSVVLNFVVYDLGDRYYHSAAVIDDLRYVYE